MTTPPPSDPSSLATNATIDYEAKVGSSSEAKLGAGGRYVILRPHAKGGLGEVFVALDEELNREVALKEIQDRYAHDPLSQARFVREAEITGRLEHPGIVPVYGLGRHSDGRPYYAMRFIQGDSFKQAIARLHLGREADVAFHSLEFRQLLGVLVSVCQAVHYAHSRRIIHRDIKPENILLGKYGESLLIDWGLSKPLSQSEETEALERVTAEAPLRPLSGSDVFETVAGAALGTPGYMSPEQAMGRADLVGTASDVYGLGATLYCLLTDQGPFADSEADEVLQKVQRGVFSPPRARKSSVPRPLEAICLKAMAREPAERYGTAKELADDLEHWLADEPVRAYREPVVPRLARWGRRHRPLAVGAAVLLISAVVALAISTVLIGRQQRATLAQKQQAERNLALAQKAVEHFLNQVTEDPRLKETDLHDLRKRLLEASLPYYEEFVRQKANDPEQEAERGRALYRLAKVRAVLGENEQALADYQQMEQLFAALVQSHPKQGDYRRDLARSYDGQGQILMALGRYKEVEEAYRRALALQKELVGDSPSVPEYQQDLAAGYSNLGRYFFLANRVAEAEPELRQALTIRKQLATAFPTGADQHWELAISHTNLGDDLQRLGRPAEAFQESSEALALLDQLVADFPRAPDYRREQVRCHYSLGALHRKQGRLKEGVKEFQRAAALCESVSRDFPSVAEYHQLEGSSLFSLALAQTDAGDLVGALKSLQRAQTIYKQLIAAHPKVPAYRTQLAQARLATAVALAYQGNYRQGAAEISQIEEPKDPDGIFPYNVACFWSVAYGKVSRDEHLTAAQREKLAEEYTAHALDWLAKARAAGYFKNQGYVQWLRKDPDLDPLRGRSDFQKFLTELEKPQR